MREVGKNTVTIEKTMLWPNVACLALNTAPSMERAEFRGLATLSHEESQEMKSAQNTEPQPPPPLGPPAPPSLSLSNLEGHEGD